MEGDYRNLFEQLSERQDALAVTTSQIERARVDADALGQKVEQHTADAATLEGELKGALAEEIASQGEALKERKAQLGEAEVALGEGKVEAAYGILQGLSCSEDTVADEASGLQPALGLLYGHGVELCYQTLQDVKGPLTLKHFKSFISGIAVAGEKAYVLTKEGPVIDVIDGRLVGEFPYPGCLDLAIVDGQIVAAGYGIRAMNAYVGNDQTLVHGVTTDDEGNMFAMIEKDGYRSLRTVVEEQGQFHLKDKVLVYDTKDCSTSDVAIIPWGKFTGYDGKEYDFSVISSANVHYLDVNSHPIDMEHPGDLMQQVVPLSLDGDMLEVACSLPRNRKIVIDKIDLGSKTCEGTSVIASLNYPVFAVEAVRSEELHKRLIGM